MPILWPDIAWELIRESNKTIFWGEAVRLTDLPAGSWSGSGHLNRCHEAVGASPHEAHHVYTKYILWWIATYHVVGIHGHIAVNPITAIGVFGA